MGQHVGITVAVESAIVGENYTPEDEGPSFYQTVNVVAVADAKLHLGQETLRFLSFLLPIVTWAGSVVQLGTVTLYNRVAQSNATRTLYLMPVAVGMIQSLGFPSILAAADASVKAARVTLVYFDKAESGQFAIAFRGPVSEVKAAMEAGLAAVENNLWGTNNVSLYCP